MKRSSCIAVAIYVLALAGTVPFATAQTVAPNPGGPGPGRLAAALQNSGDENLTGWLKQLIVELRALRRELLEQRVESHETIISQLERELEQVEAEQSRLPEEERAQNHEIATLEEQLAQSALSPDERAELEATRNRLATVELRKLRSEKASLDQRQIRLRARLQQAQQRRQSLLERTRQMGTGPAHNQTEWERSAQASPPGQK